MFAARMDGLRIRLAEAGIGVALITDDDSVHRRSKVRCWGQSGRTGGMVLTSVFSHERSFASMRGETLTDRVRPLAAVQRIGILPSRTRRMRLSRPYRCGLLPCGANYFKGRKVGNALGLRGRRSFRSRSHHIDPSANNENPTENQH